PPATVFFGEVGLAGEVRAVAQPDVRLKEASKLGFQDAVIPKRKTREGTASKPTPLRASEIKHVQDLADLFGR
ncbi:MAG: DNA repair protein RadA, partial [Alphaproteobacteria bacterium]|nr:DNA repair protein RadA [Alphaproteobacteria bacterium]